MKPKHFSVTILQRFIIVLSLMVVMGIPATVAANAKSNQLEGKTADIQLLSQQLNERKHEAISLLNEIEALKSELIAEVRVLAKSFGYRSYAAAKQNLRIYYNIELLRSLLAYGDAFSAKIRFYETGNDRLTYLHQLVQDDIRMTAALNDYQIDALTTQISLVINRYLSDAHIVRVDPQPQRLLPAAEVWKGINSGNL